MRVAQIAAQLYTMRAFLGTAAEIAATLKKLRQIGYQAVELAGLGQVDEIELAKILEGEGITCCGTHEPHVLSASATVVERLRKLNCRYAVLPFPAGIDMANPAHIDGLIAALEKTGAELRKAGHALAYHNHAIEFVQVNGKPVIQTIFEKTSPQNLQAEIDTYWVQFGGGDPVEWCQRLKDRLPLIHLKDYAFTMAGKPAMTEVGYGNLNWRKIIPAAEEAGCEWFVVEHDETPAPFESLSKSFDWISKNLCGTD
jgi:sugar phosphate isomerase/epimerase